MSSSKHLVFRGEGAPHDGIKNLPPAPPWRRFAGTPVDRALPPAPRRARFRADPGELDFVNAAICLRRPLLVTGKPGVGKSSLAHAIAWELGLGPVLTWPINTRSTLLDGLYRYDAVGRLRDESRTAGASGIGKYIQLGPLGTALVPARRPRVLLVDEIDKSDLDFPNDLLHVFEEGTFEIPELARMADVQREVRIGPHDRYDHATDEIVVTDGRIVCSEFPIVVMTSNGERDFPPPFLRRCIRLDMAQPDDAKLAQIVESHLGPPDPAMTELIANFLRRRTTAELATDQLLNALYLTCEPQLSAAGTDRGRLIEALLRELK